MKTRKYDLCTAFAITPIKTRRRNIVKRAITCKYVIRRDTDSSEREPAAIALNNKINFSNGKQHYYESYVYCAWRSRERYIVRHAGELTTTGEKKK